MKKIKSKVFICLKYSIEIFLTEIQNFLNFKRNAYQIIFDRNIKHFELLLSPHCESIDYIFLIL